MMKRVVRKLEERSRVSSWTWERKELLKLIPRWEGMPPLSPLLPHFRIIRPVVALRFELSSVLSGEYDRSKPRLGDVSPSGISWKRS